MTARPSATILALGLAVARTAGRRADRESPQTDLSETAGSAAREHITESRVVRS
jgi:hypothetical protein